MTSPNQRRQPISKRPNQASNRRDPEQEDIRKLIQVIREGERLLTGRSDYRGPPPVVTSLSASARKRLGKITAYSPLRWYRSGAHVVYVPTPQRVVNRMLEVAGVKRGDVVYDLGCGDGRIVITAAKKYKARAVGFDIDPERVKESRANVEKAGMQHRVKIKQANMFKVNLRRANVITLYLYCETNTRLLPQLRKLKPGSRIVSHDFWIDGFKPKQVVEMQADGRPRMIYLWETPLVKR